jgi:tripartite-type tricarboxylate transporter receptor subunit TctC
MRSWTCATSKSRRLVLLLAAALLSPLAAAQPFPSKPLRIIVPFPAGGTTDIAARIVAQRMQESMGQPVVVENRGGAGGSIGADVVAKSAPDGHTLLMVGFPFPLINSMFPSAKIDVLRDFTPVVNVMSSPNALVVKADSPYKSVADVLAAAKANPGKVTYASVGNGSSPHMGMELLKRSAGVDILNVPYKGSAPALTAMLGGEVDIMFDNLPNAVPHVKGGRLRTLAITSNSRSRLMPEAPTMVEAGVPGFSMDVWFGVAVPAGTPPDAVAKLNQEINRIITTPEVKARLEGMGLDVVGGSAEAFGRTIAADVAKWSAVVRDAGIKPQ